MSSTTDIRSTHLHPARTRTFARLCLLHFTPFCPRTPLPLLPLLYLHTHTFAEDFCTRKRRGRAPRARAHFSHRARAAPLPHAARGCRRTRAHAHHRTRAFAFCRAPLRMHAPRARHARAARALPRTGFVARAFARFAFYRTPARARFACLYLLFRAAPHHHTTVTFHLPTCHLPQFVRSMVHRSARFAARARMVPACRAPRWTFRAGRWTCARARRARTARDCGLPRRCRCCARAAPPHWRFADALPQFTPRLPRTRCGCGLGCCARLRWFTRTARFLRSARAHLAARGAFVCGARWHAFAAHLAPAFAACTALPLCRFAAPTGTDTRHALLRRARAARLRAAARTRAPPGARAARLLFAAAPRGTAARAHRALPAAPARCHRRFAPLAAAHTRWRTARRAPPAGWFARARALRARAAAPRRGARCAQRAGRAGLLPLRARAAAARLHFLRRHFAAGILLLSRAAHRAAALPVSPSFAFITHHTTTHLPIPHPVLRAFRVSSWRGRRRLDGMVFERHGFSPPLGSHTFYLLYRTPHLYLPLPFIVLRAHYRVCLPLPLLVLPHLCLYARTFTFSRTRTPVFIVFIYRLLPLHTFYSHLFFAFCSHTTHTLLYFTYLYGLVCVSFVHSPCRYLPLRFWFPTCPWFQCRSPFPGHHRRSVRIHG